MRQVGVNLCWMWSLICVALIAVNSAHAQSAVARPAYLDRMPSIERIATGARAAEPIDVISRQAAALFVLVDDFMPTMRGEVLPKHPDDVALVDRYRSRIAELHGEAETVRFGTATPTRTEAMAFAAQQYFPRVNRLRRDDAFKRVVVERLVGPDWQAAYARRIEENRAAATAGAPSGSQAAPPTSQVATPLPASPAGAATTAAAAAAAAPAPRSVPVPPSAQPATATTQRTGANPSTSDVKQALIDSLLSQPGATLLPGGRGVVSVTAPGSSVREEYEIVGLQLQRCEPHQKGRMCAVEYAMRTLAAPIPGRTPKPGDTAGALNHMLGMFSQAMGGTVERASAAMLLAYDGRRWELLEINALQGAGSAGGGGNCFLQCEAYENCRTAGGRVTESVSRGHFPNADAHFCEMRIQACVQQCEQSQRR